MKKPSQFSLKASSALAAMAIVAMAAALFSPLLSSSHGIFLFPSDGHVHLFWAQQFIKGLSSGVLYPRWAMDLNGGCGSVAFIFYPPFTLYTYALAYLFTPDIASALVLSLFAATLASGVSMYIFSRLFLGRGASVLSAVSYMAFPYHILDLYHRSMFSEYWSFAWVPLIMLFIHRIGHSTEKDTGKASFPYLDFTSLSVCYLGLILTNLPVAMLISIFIALHMGFCLWEERSARLFFIRTLALALGICLSAFYLLPALIEQKNANISYVTGALHLVEDNFLFSKTTNDPILLGFVNNAAICCGAIILASAFLLVYKRISGKPVALSSKAALYIAVGGLVSLFMMSGPSSLIWSPISLLRKAQYPFRMLVYTTFACSFLVGLLLNFASEMASSDRSWLAGLFLPAVFLVCGLWLSISIIKDYVGYYPSERVKAASDIRLSPDMSYEKLREAYTYFNPENARLMLAVEYRPIWTIRESPYDPLVLPGFNEPTVFVGGKAEITTSIWEPEERVLEINTTSPGMVIVRTFYYPSWKATVDGKPAQLSPHEPTGLISLNVKQGIHTIKIHFERDGVFRAGRLVSLAGLCVVAGAALLLRRLRSKEG